MKTLNRSSFTSISENKKLEFLTADFTTTEIEESKLIQYLENLDNKGKQYNRFNAVKKSNCIKFKNENEENTQLDTVGKVYKFNDFYIIKQKHVSAYYGFNDEITFSYVIYRK